MGFKNWNHAYEDISLIKKVKFSKLFLPLNFTLLMVSGRTSCWKQIIDILRGIKFLKIPLQWDSSVKQRHKAIGFLTIYFCKLWAYVVYFQVLFNIKCETRTYNNTFPNHLLL